MPPLAFPCALLLAALPAAAAAQQSGLLLTGDSPKDSFGAAVAGVPDLDGDGVPELLVGSPGDDPNGPESGAAFLYSGASGTLLRRFDGGGPGHKLGIVVAAAGDLNGDGWPDLLACAARDNDLGYPSGYVRLYSGADGSLLRTHSSSNDFDGFGASAAGAGDVDRDGFDDIVIGAPEDSWQGAAAGAAYVYSGRDGRLLHLLRGDDPWDQLGYSVAGVGDVNSDGHDDFAVGIRMDDSNGPDSGTVKVFSGLTGAPILVLPGPRPLDHYGFAVAGAGDTDGDGIPDILAAGLDDLSRLPLRVGFAQLHSGASGAVRFRLDAKSETEAFGASAAGGGDCDADGLGDLALGAPYYGFINQTGLASGAARFYSGAGGRPFGEVTGSATLDQLGTGVAWAGDMNGDGQDDWIVGIPGSGGTGAAQIYLADPVTRLEVINLVAGQTATLRTSGGLPGDEVTFVYSLAGLGQTPVTGTPLVLDLASPVRTIGMAVAGASGSAALSRSVPPGARGVRAYIQAWEASIASGRWGVTNLVIQVVQ